MACSNEESTEKDFLTEMLNRTEKQITKLEFLDGLIDRLLDSHQKGRCSGLNCPDQKKLPPKGEIILYQGMADAIKNIIIKKIHNNCPEVKLKDLAVSTNQVQDLTDIHYSYICNIYSEHLHQRRL